MFKGFNITGFSLNEGTKTDFKSDGEAVIAASELKVRTKLAEIIRSGAVLDGTRIQNSWFPQVHADIFISHSHRNADSAVALAGWLKHRFGLSSFVDSSVWGYAGELLKMIDKEYCMSPGGVTYDYDKRNESTSHVHMMLSTALGMMIDKTECLMFLNTPDSISSSDVVSKTKSPWIYSELTIAGIVRETEPSRYGMLKLSASRETNESRDVQKSIEYTLQHLDRLTEINASLLNTWSTERKEPTEHALDALYRLAAHL